MRVPNSPQSDYDLDDKSEVKSAEREEAEELSGKLSKDNRDDKLMHTVLEADKNKVDKSKVLTDAINNNITSFTPDFSFEQLVKDYKTAKQIYGERMIRELTGYEPGYIDRNVKVPEFQREMKDRIERNIDRLKKEGLLEEDGSISDEGYEFSALSYITEDLDKLESEGLQGEVENKKRSIYGEEQNYRKYKKGDRYKDISFRQTLRKSMKRGKNSIEPEDYTSSDRQAKGKLNIIYALDSSGSMKGNKISMAKKAGVALAYKAIKNKDKTGLIVFNSEIQKALRPSKDFRDLIKDISKVRTTGETDIALAIEEAIKLFPGRENNHLVLLTDAVQTLGKKPQNEVLEKVSIATSNNITITIIGINLNEEGEELAKKIVDVSSGKLYNVKKTDELDQIVIEDYYTTKSMY